ncbi:5-oxoprolinase subunit PxpA [uncultured Muriicola sp.]|uniref:5-oxoprolinase subunit PxpA n=1 Tax=uncultured Muriicola sp. TaxID=1583102 RepID=UPI00262306FA|nr:5-oxoprolinase subunit PxpA [uncultured Muriicola sp.]
MNKKWTIDINCDVGEGLHNEAQLFPFISSCNLACGGHAGDGETMNKVIRLAIKHQIKIGAHPSYPDREHFGRKSMSLPPEEFKESIRSQVELLDSLIRAHGASMHHIKAHGALYNDLAKDKELAKSYLESILHVKDTISLYVAYGSVIAGEALQMGYKIIYEAFGDRNYRKDLSLVPRSQTNAIISDPKQVLKHLLLMIKKGEVQVPEGDLVPIVANTFCIHGDTVSAYEILMYLSEELPKHHIHLEK